jgi:hypothetical protein
MPAFGEIKLADANVGLALAFSDHAHHAAARAWFEMQSDDSCAFCRVTQMALLRHLTNAKIMGAFMQNQQAAWRAYEALANDPRVVFVGEPTGVEAAFRGFSQAATPAHAVWTDAYLAALTLTIPAQLINFDQGFSRFTGLNMLVVR